MAQHDYVIANGTGAAVRSDINDVLSAIVTQNSGTSEPATTYAYQWWADTTTGLLKIRNAANNAWVTVGTLASANLGLLSSGATITAALGTAGTPGITFTGDLNTGIYSPGADQVAISTNGTGRLTIDSSGNVNIDSNTLYVDATNNRVGLGTSSPSVDLHISGSGNRYLRVQSTTLGTATLGTQSTSYGVIAGGDVYLSAGSPLTLLADGASGVIKFGTGSAAAERVRIDASGNVGIGTTSPSAVVHAARTGDSVYFKADSDSVSTVYGSASALSTGLLGTFTNHPLSFYTNSSERARIDTSGRLLVGTSTTFDSNAQFQSVGSIAGQFYRFGSDDGSIHIGSAKGTVGSPTTIANGEALGSIHFRSYNGTNYRTGAWIYAIADAAISGDEMPTRLVFSTTADGASSPTERMRIRNNGQFKVTSGTQTTRYGNTFNHVIVQDQADFSVAIESTNASPIGVVVDYTAADPNGTTNWFLYCSANGTQRASIRSNGGLANYSANNVNLSDRNSKKDIAPAVGTWDCLKEWEIVNFRYKDQPDDADLNMGVIAQQVAESCPEVITIFQEATEDQPEKLGVKDQQMMWMAIKALQEAQVRIETLEAEVAALKAS